MIDRTPRGTRVIPALIVLSFLVVGVAALVLNLGPIGAGSGPLGGQPQPQLYPDAQLPLIERLVAPAQARAHRDADHWLAANPRRSDAAFAAFALNSVGPPPDATAQRRELLMLHDIDAGRTAAGVTAATWLEKHGKKDVWKLYLKQYRQFSSPAQGARAKTLFTATYQLANILTARGKTRFGRPSPYITDPSLHGLNQSRFAKKVSYPARHSVISFALAALLAHYEPHRAPEYTWMAEEIAYSRLYAGGHYPSDVAAGAYLGTLLTDYELRVPPPPAATG